MAIIKAKQKEYHARVPNETARDKNLSLEAKGLLCILLSMDEDWKIYKKQIADFSTNGYHSTRRAFDELIENGYIVDLGRIRSDKGFLKENLYEVHAEKAVLNRNKPIAENRTVDNRTVDNHQLSNYTINSIENKEKEKQEVNLNINTEPSSVYQSNDLFGGKVEVKTPVISSKKEKDKKEETVREKIIEFWLKEFHIGWDFNSTDGRNVNSIIKKLEKTLSSNGNVVNDESILNLFKAFCLKLPDYYKDKKLRLLESDYDSIIDQIKRKNNGKQQTTNKGQFSWAKYDAPDPRESPNWNTNL